MDTLTDNEKYIIKIALLEYMASDRRNTADVFGLYGADVMASLSGTLKNIARLAFNDASDNKTREDVSNELHIK